MRVGVPAWVLELSDDVYSVSKTVAQALAISPAVIACRLSTASTKRKKGKISELDWRKPKCNNEEWWQQKLG
jgi:hypothetical protein